uniref:Uncharacterized protein n=1 Tax=Setaria viridis TaxID=4556 RepID=A0A4U6U756_SETVI|nr:hypothetical protein SEVIR_6G158850v2 [Setaria viridis]
MCLQPSRLCRRLPPPAILFLGLQPLRRVFYLSPRPRSTPANHVAAELHPCCSFIHQLWRSGDAKNKIKKNLWRSSDTLMIGIEGPPLASIGRMLKLSISFY